MSRLACAFEWWPCILITVVKLSGERCRAMCPSAPHSLHPVAAVQRPTLPAQLMI